MNKELITAFQNKEKAELLLANLEKLYSDNTVKEASYNILKSEYSVALKNAQSKIDSIKQELNKILRTRTHELDVYKQELAHLEARFKVGQFTADTYLKQAKNPQKKVSDLTDQVAYLSSMINAKQSDDIPDFGYPGANSILASLGNMFKSRKQTMDSFDLLFPAVVSEEVVAQAEQRQIPDTVNVSNLCILPERVLPGSSVGVIATIINTGSETVLHKTEFKINNITQSTNEITLSPGQCEELTFMMTAGAPGDYFISIDNVTGTLHVLPGSNPASNTI